MQRYSPLFSFLLLLACSSPSSVAPISVPLSYKTMLSPGELPTVPQCAALSGLDVEDARGDKIIGKRFVEGKPSAVASVTASTDVAGWAKAGAGSMLKNAGMSTGKGGAPVLYLRIEHIHTSENVLHRAGYEGRLVISAELRPAGGTTSCWQDRAEGFAENYGYPGSVENYQETLNHALDRAMVRLLSSPAFTKAVCGCGA